MKALFNQLAQIFLTFSNQIRNRLTASHKMLMSFALVFFMMISWSLLRIPSRPLPLKQDGLINNSSLKQEELKGFELFDTNTWIKGEKEIQVLELRALKGQLEKDLITFESINAARVVLDIPPQKNFQNSREQAKASVILTLKPQARLTASTLKAISYHLSGAIRGLTPEMIAISDTSGRLYQALHHQEELDNSSLLEEQLTEKIALLLAHLVGQDHFHLSIQKGLSCSIAIAIDQKMMDDKVKENFQIDLEHQILTIAQGYGLMAIPVIDFFSFEKKELVPEKIKQTHSFFWLFTSLLFGMLMMAIFLFAHRIRKGKKRDEHLFRMMTQIDLKKLANSIQYEDPQTIALMLSYLEPSRAEKIMAAFNKELQEEILTYLSELEKGRD